LEHLNLVIGVILGIFAMIAYIKGFFGWVRDLVAGLFSNQLENLIHIPKKTMTILVKPSAQHSWWHMGRTGENPAMQIHISFTATNVSKLNVLPIQAKIKKPKIHGHVLTRDFKSNMYGSHDIPSNVTTDLTADFWIFPPVKKEGQTFIVDVSIMDQYGNEHWTRGIPLAYH
jgi:hypothetical protein